MRQYFQPEGQRIQFPTGTSYVDKKGEVFRYYNRSLRRWYMVSKSSSGGRPGWLVREYSESELNCCGG